MSGPSSPALPKLPGIAVAMWGLDPLAIGVNAPAGGERVREIIGWLAKAAPAGVRGVRLDATMSGIRPRELDRSGRRDLASLLRRGELTYGGVDVFVPPEHLIKADMVDRAMASILGAIDLAADVAALAAGAVASRATRSANSASVGLAIHEKTPPDVVRTIADHAEARGVRIANHAWPIVEVSGSDPDAAIGIGLDSAVALAASADPVGLAARLGRRLACARVGDVGAGGERVMPGKGRLDVGAYLVTLATCGYSGPAVLDMRGLKHPAEAMRAVSAAAAGGVGGF
jgi:sugar phosphate isomerase/epimerase